MSPYHRTTRECTIAQLRPELAQAVRAYAQQRQWANLDADVVMCCETTAEKMGSRKLDVLLYGDRDMVTYLALIITSQRLIWARSGERAGTGAASAKLTDVRLKIFTTKHTQDLCVEVYGRMEGSRDRVGGRLMLGPDPAAQKFCREVMNALDSLNPPASSKPRRKWFGR